MAVISKIENKTPFHFDGGYFAAGRQICVLRSALGNLHVEAI